MIAPPLILTLHDMPSEALRELIAHAAGIHAHRDGDNGETIRDVLERIGARLAHQPRKRAHE